MLLKVTERTLQERLAIDFHYKHVTCNISMSTHFCLLKYTDENNMKTNYIFYMYSDPLHGKVL